MERINELVDGVFLFAMEETYREEILKSRELFSSVINDDVEKIENGYNAWIVFDYKLNNENNFIEEYISVHHSSLNKDDLKILNDLNEAVFSVFEVVTGNDKRFFKDIVTNKDFEVTNIDNWKNGLCKGRLVKSKNKYVLLDDYLNYEIGFKEIIRKGILNKYNEYCSTVEPIEIEAFVRGNSVIIYRLLDIIDSLIDDEKNDFQDMFVFQSNYLVKDYSQAKTCLNESKDVAIDDEYDDEIIYRFKGINENLAEILLSQRKLEVECNSEENLAKSKILIEGILGNIVQFMDDEMLRLEDLL